MKWIYGKQDLKDLDRAQENCFLMTNGLGGFSSLTMAGSAARNDHAVLMACIKAPNHRYNMVHRLRERLYAGTPGTAAAPSCAASAAGDITPASTAKAVPGSTAAAGAVKVLSSQEFAHSQPENGLCCLSSFIYEDTPVWRIDAGGVEIIKEMGLARESNTAAVQYSITNRTGRPYTLEVTPFLQFTKKGEELQKSQAFTAALSQNSSSAAITSGGLTMDYRTSGHCELCDEWESYYYSYDACDGRRSTGGARGIVKTTATVAPKSSASLDLVFEVHGEAATSGAMTAREVIQSTKDYCQGLKAQAGFTREIAGELAKAAGQFVAHRESTGGQTILAGFPFFEDWGRDTMIALPGVCIATKQLGTARSILRTFAVNEKNGLMPNLFPEGGNKPMYNTVDAALLFINCVWLYHKASGDLDFVREMYPVMESIIQNYKNGTDFAIHMDTDGLIMAGSGLDQVTWMDVRVGEILPTPRHGKPVEINAYWYNALKIMAAFSGLLGKEGSAYDSLAGQVRQSFNEKFWNEEAHCLKDVLSGTMADTQIRCNQIWAVSMPFTMLERDKERQVVETVFEKLYTPYGLRTLAMEDEQFHPFYGGEMMERDLAYHQGTVWTFPLGAYYLASLKVHDNSSEEKQHIREQLAVLEAAMREGCIGQLPEIYDGANPTSSRGCFAQAWSVGEILRVYEALE